MWVHAPNHLPCSATCEALRCGAGADVVRAQILGDQALPWEVSDCRELRTLKRSVLQCLSRDPLDRPTAADLLATWRNLLDFAAVKHTVVTAAPAQDADTTQDTGYDDSTAV